MGTRSTLRHTLALCLPLAIVACAQLQGLDSYENVDCVGDDCTDAGSTPETGSGTNEGGGPADTGPTCPPCTNGQVCDPKSSKCVECLPGTKECTAGSFCDPDDTLGYKCVLGCAVVDDCIKAGFGPDGGDAGDAGDASDAGAAGPIACCNNRCVDTSLDGKNCGMCGNSCGASGACCDSTCLDIVSTPTSCGGCGIVCSNKNITTPTCGAKTCTGTCDDGWADCNMNKQSDGCETDIFNDPNKCGGCTKVCSNNHIPTPACTLGKCTGACTGTFRDCNGNKQVDGCEVDISSDKLNCGGCDNVCSNSHITTPSCSGGNCNGACDTGYKDCDNQKLVNGCETHISGAGADPNNCGNCGIVCSNAHIATPTCNGTCNAACDANWGDCNNDKAAGGGDGCETDLLTSAANCGACGQACSSNHVTPACTSVANMGKCTGTCDAGWSDCDLNKLTNGCETNTQTDSQRCGACNVACGAGMRKCVFNSGTGTSSCQAGYGATSSPATFIDACVQAGKLDLKALLTATGGDTPDDEGITSAQTLPITFSFNGVTQSKYWVWSNGAIVFSATPADPGGFGAYACPGPDATRFPNATIMPFTDDLKGSATFELCAATIGATAGTRKYVITFKHEGFYVDGVTSEGDITFSVILNESGNTIDVIFQALSTTNSFHANGASATVGVQPSTTSATTYSCDQAFITPTTAIRFLP